MTIQNIYDNDTFFAGYKKIRNQQYNYNTLLEQPQLIKMLPALEGKRVLDIGCGAGHFITQCIEKGAVTGVGIDVSSNMISLAKETNNHPQVTFLNEAIEHTEFKPASFDFICSSLALHYVKDFDTVVDKVSKALAPNGTFLFSHHHPITSANLAEDDWVKDDNGNPLYLKVHRYFDESERHIKWVIDDVIMYHRTLTTLINTLIKHGLQIDEIAESVPTTADIEKMPSLRKELERPCFIFIKASKR